MTAVIIDNHHDGLIAVAPEEIGQEQQKIVGLHPVAQDGIPAPGVQIQATKQDECAMSARRWNTELLATLLPHRPDQG